MLLIFRDFQNFSKNVKLSSWVNETLHIWQHHLQFRMCVHSIDTIHVNFNFIHKILISIFIKIPILSLRDA